MYQLDWTALFQYLSVMVFFPLVESKLKQNLKMGCCPLSQGQSKEPGRRTFIRQLDEIWKSEDAEMFEIELAEISGEVPSRFRMEEEEDIVASLHSRSKIQIQFPV